MTDSYDKILKVNDLEGELEEMREQLLVTAKLGGQFDLDRYLRLMKQVEQEKQWKAIFGVK